MHAVAEATEHRLGQCVFIPRAFVTAAIDEERWRDDDAAALCALPVLLHASPRRLVCGSVFAIARREIELAGDFLEVAGADRRTPLHQRVVHRPKLTGSLGRKLRQLRRARCIVILSCRSMTEDIPHAAAEPIPQTGDNFVRGVTRIPRIIAVLDQRQFSILVA